jgi:CheY-like chemotaxis protein
MSKDCLSFVIAIADDDRDDQEFIQDALRQVKTGACVATVFDGEQLLHLLQNEGRYSNLEKFEPDFVILDINMPLVNGIRTLEIMQKDTSLCNIPVYVLATNYDEALVDRAKALGARAYFKKPASLSGYKDILRVIFSSQRHMVEISA